MTGLRDRWTNTENGRSIYHAWCNVLHAMNHLIGSNELREKLISDGDVHETAA